ncbi:hypothetical protein BpHYR1_010920 [Brachionus plicatilis]|uniref:Uncharacterized protein n=1 Tax=Brachionus plicatilis TaxID=10195 RepID=A0A3M7SCR2_BRAPC|nr:hypothetical protein BpHYR1_010920 [Brachionus plicatilis]
MATLSIISSSESWLELRSLMFSSVSAVFTYFECLLFANFSQVQLALGSISQIVDVHYVDKLSGDGVRVQKLANVKFELVVVLTIEQISDERLRVQRYRLVEEVFGRVRLQAADLGPVPDGLADRVHNLVALGGDAFVALFGAPDSHEYHYFVRLDQVVYLNFGAEHG